MSLSERINIIKNNSETSQAGSKWTKEEEEKLLQSIENGIDIHDIAKEHKRTQGGILSRITHIAIDMIENKGKDINDVCKYFQLDKTELIDRIKRLKNKIAVRNRKSNDVSKVRKPESNDSSYNNSMIFDVLVDIRNILSRIESKIQSNKNNNILTEHD